jgi:hypothetical protein
MTLFMLCYFRVFLLKGLDLLSLLLSLGAKTLGITTLSITTLSIKNVTLSITTLSL